MMEKALSPKVEGVRTLAWIGGRGVVMKEVSKVGEGKVAKGLKF